MIAEGIVQVFIKYAVVLNVILRGIDDLNQRESAVGATDLAPSVPVYTPVTGDSSENTDVLPENKLYIIERETWLAQPPSKSAPKLRHPVPYVIISQTTTEPCKTQADCTYRVRITQTYDIESQNWNDIGCNFMIGGDGYAYEGRGWEAVGEGLNGYEPRSIGISFIGTFKNDEPPGIQLKAAEELIKLGVEGGKIAPDYKLLALRQIARDSNPGDALYNIIKTWPHWVPSFEATLGTPPTALGLAEPETCCSGKALSWERSTKIIG